MEKDVIYCGDCLDVMKTFPDESIDLIYLDPPFFSQKYYENFWIHDKTSRLGFSDKDWEKLRSSINPTILNEYEAIEARWKGGHKGIYVYIAYMRERLEQCWRVLKKTGTIYLHCDWHAGHYLKVMMDEVFGYENFINEIVWNYSIGGRGKNRFARKHDTIFFYSKDNNKYLFYEEAIRVPMDAGTKSFGGRLETDEQGRKYRLVYGKGSKKYYKYYLDEGKMPEDVWQIQSIQSQDKERLGYPTQKPEELLDRIIKASSKEGDIVLDPFCGCGTSIAVAKKLNRNWIGIDISRIACDVMKKRIGGKTRVIGGESEEELRKMEPHQFARLIIMEKLGGTINPKTTGDMGIDGWVDFMSCPVQVKRWEHKVGRPEIDKFRTAIQREHKSKGMIVAFNFSKDCFEEVERIKHEDKIEIILKSIKEIFNHN